MDYTNIILVLVILGLGGYVFYLLRNRKGGRFGILVGELRNKEENKRKILAFMEEKALVADRDQLRIVNNDVEKLLGVSNATAERYLHELEEDGILKQMGIVGRGVYYEKLK